MALIAGRLGKLAVSDDGGSTWSDVGALRDVNFNPSKAMLNATNKDTGGYEAFEHGHKSGTITGGADYDEANAGQAIIIAAYYADTTIKARFRMRGDTSGAAENISDALVSDMNPSQPITDLSKFDFTLQLSGSFAQTTQP